MLHTVDDNIFCTTMKNSTYFYENTCMHILLHTYLLLVLSSWIIEEQKKKTILYKDILTTTCYASCLVIFITYLEGVDECGEDNNVSKCDPLGDKEGARQQMRVQHL